MATYTKKAGDSLKVDLNIAYGDKSLSKSIEKSFSEQIIQRKEVDSTDEGVEIAAFNDASYLGSALKNITVCAYIKK